MATVTYDVTSKITQYKQPTSTSCATTCAGMCVNKSPTQLKNAGFDLDYANWSGIASAYDYKVIPNDSASFANVLSYVKQGYPVVIKIADAETYGDTSDHWVVIVKFEGMEINPQAANFTCADPAKTTSSILCTLTSATLFNTKIISHKIRVFTQS